MSEFTKAQTRNDRSSRNEFCANNIGNTTIIKLYNKKWSELQKPDHNMNGKVAGIGISESEKSIEKGCKPIGVSQISGQIRDKPGKEAEDKFGILIGKNPAKKELNGSKTCYRAWVTSWNTKGKEITGISWGKGGDKDVKKSKLDRASLSQPAAPARLRPYSASRRHSASVSTDTLCCCVHCVLIAAAACPPRATQSIYPHANQRRCSCHARHVIDKESVIGAIENVREPNRLEKVVIASHVS
uniref:Uncharacterized protein n=1 Tax=Panagrellus redivivus TaxID=6233 RepID=A0A7E4ZZY2_PANRE